MPQIDLISIPQYQTLQPYHVDFDNLPLKALMTRMALLNSAVDVSTDILRHSVGNQGSLQNRLSQSIEDDGSLKKTAVDKTLHNAGAHANGVYEGVEYVTMTKAERSKLDLIADESTRMVMEFHTPSNIVSLEDGPIVFMPSDGVTWSVAAPNTVKANLTFPTSTAHKHYYGKVPQNNGTHYKDYKTGYPNYIADALRVFINGVRIYEDDEVYVPGPLVSSPWTLNSFIGYSNDGSFVLLHAVTSEDVIRVDFDVSQA